MGAARAEATRQRHKSEENPREFMLISGVSLLSVKGDLECDL